MTATDATDVRDLLVSLQLADSAFPSGLYTMSHGLEGYCQAGEVRPDEVEELLRGLLVHSVGPADATALARAHEAVRAGDWERVCHVDRLLFASKLNAEARRASVRSGHQVTGVALTAIGGPELTRWQDLVTARETPGCQPVASAVAYAAAGVDAERAVASDLFAFAASFVGAALRLRLLDHLQVQVVLRAVAPSIAAAAAAAVRRDVHDLGACAPMADAMSARHERAEARLFTS